MTITPPLRLAVGSHEPGSGKGCAMNMLAWIHDPSNITDYPACTARPLARIVQLANDTICDERDDGLLCPTCSEVAIELALSADGTASDDMALHAMFAEWCALRVRHLRSDATGYGTAADHANHAAEYASLQPRCTDDAAALNAAYHAMWAVSVDAAIVSFDNAHAKQLQFARAAIAEWHRLAGTTPDPVGPGDVARAAELMRAVA